MSKEELLDRLSNAYSTWVYCRGWGKSLENARLITKYRAELKERFDFEIATDDIPPGKINGPGSF